MLAYFTESNMSNSIRTNGNTSPLKTRLAMTDITTLTKR